MAKRWYSVSVLSNFEKKDAEQIRTADTDAPFPRWAIMSRKSRRPIISAASMRFVTECA